MFRNHQLPLVFCVPIVRHCGLIWTEAQTFVRNSNHGAIWHSSCLLVDRVVIGYVRFSVWANSPLDVEISPMHPDDEIASVFEDRAPLTTRGAIDEIVFEGLRRSAIQPAKLCSDQVFLRRVYLDVIGKLPTVEEASGFFGDSSLNKRAVLIDQLLLRDEFADYWAMKWSDLLRVKAEFPINLWPMGAAEYYKWIVAAIRKNQPYDQFARDLLTSSGSNFREGPVNFYRAVQGRGPDVVAQAVALTFMGTRIEHWPETRRRDLAAFFSQLAYKPTGEWKEEIVIYDPGKPLPRAEVAFPDGSRARLEPGRDPRQAFADWLTSPGNPWFARNLVNRIWAWLLGRGIVHEPDDLRSDNPPAFPELLAFLEKELIAAGYDSKRIFRLILNSSTYQLSSIPRSENPDRGKYFACYPVRRVDAEVLIDTICQIAGLGEQYSSAAPEPYTIMPAEQPAIGLPDGSVSSPFLELFGRPPRDTGFESERNNQTTAAQRLHLLNSTHIERKIEQSPALQQLLRSAAGLDTAAKQLYLSILSRYPTEAELNAILVYVNSGGGNRRQAAVDVAWALMNSAEFVYRH